MFKNRRLSSLSARKVTLMNACRESFHARVKKEEIYHTQYTKFN